MKRLLSMAGAQCKIIIPGNGHILWLFSGKIKLKVNKKLSFRFEKAAVCE
jgi:hypothetical protein